MGYYTYYTLTTTPEEDFLIITLFRSDCERAEYAISQTGNALERCKWYEWEEDLRAFSVKHPDVLFKLHGEGEESEDIWDAYFQNGKMQLCKAQIVIPPFDAGKLE